jgi:hypothetical protein
MRKTQYSEFDNLEGDIFCLFHRQDPTNGDSKTENTQPICRICQSLIIGQNDFIDASLKMQTGPCEAALPGSCTHKPAIRGL